MPSSRRRKGRAKRLTSPPATLINVWRATLVDVFSRVGELWRERLLAGWDERLRLTSGGRLPGPERGDARKAEPLQRTLDRVKVETLETIDASGLDEAAEEVGERVSKFCSSELQRVFSIPTSTLLSPSIVEGFREKNVSLIKSLATDRLDEVSDILRNADAKGLRYEVVAAQLSEQLEIGKRHAELIARDQIGSLNAVVTKRRQEDAGITEYTWRTVSDERVRPVHADLDGTRQSWDDPPVIDEEGGTGHPGEDIQCRCQAIPIVPWLDE